MGRAAPAPAAACVSGAEALWVALHGFAFALVALVVGLEHLSPTGMAALLAGGGSYLLTLAEAAEHATVLDWAPLVIAVASAGLLAQGGARFAGGKGFFPEQLTTGVAPSVVLSVLGGYVLAALQTRALSQGPAQGAEEWIPLLIAVGAAGLFAASGARYGASDGKAFFPPALIEGQGPRNFLLAVGLFVGAAFLGRVEAHKGSWEHWIALGAAAAAAGLAAAGGARYAQGGAFFPESLTSGPVPAAVMALLGAFVYTAWQEAASGKALAAAAAASKGRWGRGAATPAVTPGAMDEWMPLTLTAVLAGLAAAGGARYGQDKPVVPEALLTAEAKGPALMSLALGCYAVLALNAVAAPETKGSGGATAPWLNLVGAATVAGALSFYGQQRRRAAVAT